MRGTASATRRAITVAAVMAIAMAGCGRDGGLAWRTGVGAVDQAGVSVVGEVAVVAAGVDDDPAVGSDLVGLDVASGEERWRWSAPGGLLALPHVVTVGDLVVTVVATVEPTQVCAVAADDGVEHWCIEVASDALGRGPPTNPQLTGDDVQVVATGADGVVRSFDAVDGSLRWERELETPAEDEERVVPGDVVIVDDVVVVGSGAVVHGSDDDALRGAVSGLDAETGDVLWEVASPLGVILRHRLTVDGDDVIVQGVSVVQKLDATTGAERWEVTVPPPPDRPRYADAVAHPAVVGDLVVVLALGSWAFPRDSGALHAIDRGTGRLRWSLADDTPPLTVRHVDEILAGLGAVDDGLAVVGEDLTILDPDDGTVRRSVDLGLSWGQPFAAGGGRVLAVDPDGEVVAATTGD